MTWSKLRALGIGLWLTDPSVLRATAESLAKAQYAVSKDPHEAALLYAALGKKGVLQGLFRSSSNKKVCGAVRAFQLAADGRVQLQLCLHLLQCEGDPFRTLLPYGQTEQYDGHCNLHDICCNTLQDTGLSSQSNPCCSGPVMS
jgi:hypothetical protein